MYFPEKKIRLNIWCIFLEQTWIFITFFMTWYMNDDYTHIKSSITNIRKNDHWKKSKPYLWTINHRIMYVYKKNTGPSHISYLILIFGIQIRYNKRKYLSGGSKKKPTLISFHAIICAKIALFSNFSYKKNGILSVQIH